MITRTIRNLVYFTVGVFLAASFMLGTTHVRADHNGRHSVASTVHKMHEPGASCSAVMLAPGRAITAAHCINMTSPVLTIEGVDYPILEAYRNPERDLAILIVPDAPCPCATVSDTRVVEGDVIAVIGYPYGIARVVTYGEVQARVISDFDGREYVLATAASLPGNSGGGVFALDGRLVGISAQGLQVGTMSLFVDFVEVVLSLQGERIKVFVVK